MAFSAGLMIVLQESVEWSRTSKEDTSHGDHDRKLFAVRWHRLNKNSHNHFASWNKQSIPNISCHPPAAAQAWSNTSKREKKVSPAGHFLSAKLKNHLWNTRWAAQCFRVGLVLRLPQGPSVWFPRHLPGEPCISDPMEKKNKIRSSAKLCWQLCAAEIEEKKKKAPAALLATFHCIIFHTVNLASSCQAPLKFRTEHRRLPLFLAEAFPWNRERRAERRWLIGAARSGRHYIWFIINGKNKGKKKPTWSTWGLQLTCTPLRGHAIGGLRRGEFVVFGHFSAAVQYFYTSRKMTFEQRFISHTAAHITLSPTSVAALTAAQNRRKSNFFQSFRLFQQSQLTLNISRHQMHMLS